jgi:hypothetical protein
METSRPCLHVINGLPDMGESVLDHHLPFVFRIYTNRDRC